MEKEKKKNKGSYGNNITIYGILVYIYIFLRFGAKINTVNYTNNE
jgi:hypothetical protein